MFFKIAVLKYLSESLARLIGEQRKINPTEFITRFKSNQKEIILVETLISDLYGQKKLKEILADIPKPVEERNDYRPDLARIMVDRGKELSILMSQPKPTNNDRLKKAKEEFQKKALKSVETLEETCDGLKCRKCDNIVDNESHWCNDCLDKAIKDLEKFWKSGGLNED